MMNKDEIKLSLKQRVARLIHYFMKGLLIILPFAITFSVIKSIVVSLDAYVDVGIPAVGFLIVIASITLLGVIGSSIITRPLFSLFDDFLSRIPFVKIIYTSVKEFMEAFVGDNRKFNQPVIVELSPGVLKPGFITKKDLSKIKLEGYVAVYFPHSYAFSGNLFLVEASKIRTHDGDPAELMKFIVSGGVTSID
jgi:uncharacterized membrane protein